MQNLYIILCSISTKLYLVNMQAPRYMAPGPWRILDLSLKFTYMYL